MAYSKAKLKSSGDKSTKFRKGTSHHKYLLQFVLNNKHAAVNCNNEIVTGKTSINIKMERNMVIMATNTLVVTKEK